MSSREPGCLDKLDSLIDVLFLPSKWGEGGVTGVGSDRYGGEEARRT